MRRGSGWSSPAFALGVCLAAGAAAQEPEAVPSLRSAVLDADATRGARAEVRVTYGLTVPAGTEAVPLTVLSPAPAAVDGLTARSDDGPLAVELPPSETSQRSGVVRIRAGAAARDMTLVLTYGVDGAFQDSGDGIRVMIPVVAVDWPPSDPLPGTFQARVQLPPDVTPYESFPTTVGGLARGGTDPGPSVLELSVQPAWVSLRARHGPPPTWTVPRVADAFVVLLLLGLGAVGWGRMRERL